MEINSKRSIVHCKQKRRKCLEENKEVIIRECERLDAHTAPLHNYNNIDCGGCPGSGLFEIIQNLLEEGNQEIVLASCITGYDNSPYPCTNFKGLEEEIGLRFGNQVSCLG